MGGTGSGPGKSLAVFEEGLKLDLRRLRQQGIFVPNGNYAWMTLRWTDGYGDEVASASISYEAGAESGWFEIRYKFTEYDGRVHDVKERLNLVRFRQPFGGYRVHQTFGKADAELTPDAPPMMRVARLQKLAWRRP